MKKSLKSILFVLLALGTAFSAMSCNDDEDESGKSEPNGKRTTVTISKDGSEHSFYYLTVGSEFRETPNAFKDSDGNIIMADSGFNQLKILSDGSMFYTETSGTEYNVTLSSRAAIGSEVSATQSETDENVSEHGEDSVDVSWYAHNGTVVDTSAKNAFLKDHCYFYRKVGDDEEEVHLKFKTDNKVERFKNGSWQLWDDADLISATGGVRKTTEPLKRESGKTGLIAKFLSTDPELDITEIEIRADGKASYCSADEKVDGTWVNSKGFVKVTCTYEGKVISQDCLYDGECLYPTMFFLEPCKDATH